jgi:hypothetical protein
VPLDFSFATCLTPEYCRNRVSLGSWRAPYFELRPGPVTPGRHTTDPVTGDSYASLVHTC